MSEISVFPIVRLEEAVDILDNLRVPINGTERLGRVGSIPYYGANGQQGWIDRPLFDEPLILLAEDGGNFDDFATRPIAYRIDGPSWINNHAHVIRAKQGVCQSYIFWSIVNKDIRKFIAGGTRTKLNQGELRRIEIALPDESERQVIAKVLDTLDTAIQQTEAIVDKLKQVKQGLLYDLLTRGIDANGELRPSYEKASQLYQNSPIGLVPKEWEVVTLEMCTTKIADRDHTTPVYVEDGICMISPVNFYGDEEIDFDGCKRITLRAHEVNRKKTDIQSGDILLHRIGAGLGRVRRVLEWMPEFSILHSMAQIRPNETQMLGSYMLWAIRSESTKRQIALGTQSIGVPDLGLEKIGGFLVPRPSLVEQKMIATQLAAIQEKITTEESRYLKLRNVKIGLMDDLLTGRVRVTPLLAQSQ